MKEQTFAKIHLGKDHKMQALQRNSDVGKGPDAKKKINKIIIIHYLHKRGRGKSLRD